jgi:hypothetical protein
MRTFSVVVHSSQRFKPYYVNVDILAWLGTKSKEKIKCSKMKGININILKYKKRAGEHRCFDQFRSIDQVNK